MTRDGGKDAAISRAEYCITEDDHVRATQLSMRRKKRVLWFALTTFFVFIIVFEPGEITFYASLAAVAAVVLLGTNLLVEPYLFRKQYRAKNLANQLTRLEMFDGGLKFTVGGDHLEIPWESIVKSTQNDDYVLVYVKTKLFLVIPKRMAEEGFDVDGLERKLAGFSTSGE